MEQNKSRIRSNINDKHSRKVTGIGGVSTFTPAQRNSKQVVPRMEVKQHKKQIPKQLRYDLENALLGLCDVWFDEIKPHLISNQIKLHVGEFPSSIKKNHPITSQPMSCSHTDPTSTSPSCELCRLLVAATHNIKQALTQAISSGASISSTSSNVGPRYGQRK